MAHAPLVHSIRVLLQGPRQSVDAPAVQDFILTRFALFVHQESTNHHWEMKRVLDVQPMQIQSLDRLHLLRAHATKATMDPTGPPALDVRLDTIALAAPAKFNALQIQIHL